MYLNVYNCTCTYKSIHIFIYKKNCTMGRKGEKGGERVCDMFFMHLQGNFLEVVLQGRNSPCHCAQILT